MSMAHSYFVIIVICCSVEVFTQDPEWIPFESHEYYFASTNANFNNAQATCEELGAFAASIQSFEEHTFINQHLDPLDPNETIHYWIGLYHAENGCDGCRNEILNSSACTRPGLGVCCDCRLEWGWTDGSQMKFMNWMFNEPTGQNNPCGRIGRARSTMPVTEGLFWFDFDCNEPCRFICKRAIRDIPTTDESSTSTTHQNNDESNDDVLNDENNKKSDNEMAIGAGIGASSVAAFVFLAGGIYIFVKRIRKKKVIRNRDEHVYYNNAGPHASPLANSQSQRPNQPSPTADNTAQRLEIHTQNGEYEPINMDLNHTRYNTRHDEAVRAQREARVSPELTTNYEPVNLDLTPSCESVMVNPELTSNYEPVNLVEEENRNARVNQELVTNYEPVNFVEEENRVAPNSYTTLAQANTEGVEGDDYERPDAVGFENGLVIEMNDIGDVIV